MRGPRQEIPKIAASRGKKAGRPAQGDWASQDEDVQLMLAFQAGRTEAFRQLVERNQAKVFAVIYRLISDRAAVEDLTQEVFLRVFRTAGRYRPMAKFSTWLYRIAYNVALNAIRGQRKMRMMALELPDGDEEASWHRDVPDTRTGPPHSHLDTSELAEKIDQAIAALPENQRMAIILNKYEHMTYQEIADILDCSTMAVKSLLSRARCNLRGTLVRYLGKEFVKRLPNP